MLLLHKHSAPHRRRQSVAQEQLKPMLPLELTWGEVFEPAIADLYNIRSHEPDLIVDVGAFTCLAAHTHSQATVHAFEPSPQHAHRLEENIALVEKSMQPRVTRVISTATYSQIGAGGQSAPGTSDATRKRYTHSEAERHDAHIPTRG